MQPPFRFGIIRCAGANGRVIIEGMGELEAVWLFADAINFRAFADCYPQTKAAREIGNVVVFSGISTDHSSAGIERQTDGTTLSRVAALVDILVFPCPPPPAIFRRRPTQMALIEAARNDNLAAVEQELEADADPNSCDDKGNSALLHAVTKNNLEMVTLLGSYGADPLRANNSGVDPTNLATEQGKRALLSSLGQAEKQCRLARVIAEYLVR